MTAPLTLAALRELALACGADDAGEVWIDVVTKKTHPLRAVLLHGLRVRGKRSLLSRFAACFPR